MTNTRAKPSNSRGEYPRGPQPDPATWGEPEQVNPKNVLVEGDRLPVDEDIVAALMATINTGNGKVLPPIHLWEKQPGSDLILVAGRNRLEAHKRTEHWVSARIIRGETPEIVRAVKLCEIEENFNRRKLSPALRKMYTAQLKVFYEEQHPETKAGKAGGLGKARKSAVPRSGTAPAFTKAHAKRTGGRRARSRRMRPKRRRSATKPYSALPAPRSTRRARSPRWPRWTNRSVSRSSSAPLPAKR